MASKNKFLVLTDKDLFGKKYLGINVVTTTKLPKSSYELQNFFEELVKPYVGYLVDREWYNRIGRPLNISTFPRIQGKVSDVTINTTHSQSTILYADYLEYSTLTNGELELSIIPMSADNSAGEKPESVEAFFSVSITGTHLLPYLEAIELLHDEDEYFLVTFNYSGDTDKNNLTWDGIIVKAGELTDVVLQAQVRYKSLVFDTVELYRLGKANPIRQNTIGSNGVEDLLMQLVHSNLSGK